MKVGEVLLTAAISTVMTIGVFWAIDHFHSRGNQENSDESEVNETEEAVTEEKHYKVDIAGSAPELVTKKEPPQTKKKSLFGGMKKKVGEAVVAKKLLDEIEKRDIYISISLMKGEK